MNKRGRNILLLAVLSLNYGLAKTAWADGDASLMKDVACFKAIGRFTETDHAGAPFIAKAMQSQTMHLSKNLKAAQVTDELLVAAQDRQQRPGVFWARNEGIYFYPLEVGNTEGEHFLNYPGGDGTHQLRVTISQNRITTQNKTSAASKNGVDGAMNTEGFSRQVIQEELQRRLKRVSDLLASSSAAPSKLINGLNQRKGLPDDFLRTNLDKANSDYQKALQSHPHAAERTQAQTAHSQAVESIATQKLEADFNPNLRTFMNAVQNCEKVDARDVHLTAQRIENTVQPYVAPLTAYSASPANTSSGRNGSAALSGNAATVKTNHAP